MKTLKLTTKEVNFIKEAFFCKEAIYDFENNTDKEFKEYYGVSPKELDKVLDGLRNKIG